MVYVIKIEFIQTSNEREKVKQIFDIDRYNRLVVERKEGKLVYQAMIKTDVEYSSTQIDEIMKENDFILTLERCDEMY